MSEFVFEGTYNELVCKAMSQREIKLPDIVSLLRTLQANEADCHVAVCGQNGSGKSYLMLMLMKTYMGKLDYENLYLADKTTNDIIRFLLTHRDTPLCIDEMNLYFGYKQHASPEQNHLINMVELARSKCIPIIGCIRDPRKLTLNYRNGKLSVCLWVLDRWKKGEGAYAAVFVSNSMVEGDDRFGWQYLTVDNFDYDQMRHQIEHVPSFIGYIRIPPIGKILTPEEIAGYKKQKDVAQAYAHLNHVIRMLRKGKISPEDAEIEIAVLEKVIPDARERMPQPKDKGQQRLLSETSDVSDSRGASLRNMEDDE